MIKIIIATFLSLFTVCTGNGQSVCLPSSDSLIPPKGKFASNGLRKGKWVFYRSNGFISAQGRYLPRIVKDSAWVIDVETFEEVAYVFYEEQKVGKWRTYIDEGKLLWLTVYSKRIGKKKSITYSDNGLAFYERRRKDHFVVRKDYHENGKIHWVVHYNKMGKINGRYRKWDEDGKLIEKGRYRNGEKVGIWKSWKDKGAVCKVRYRK
jgi:antitoxin component YwqK of YwqJK toxin-antitoxin module